jgi:phage repressor protein C with HTH and peptisase S24 domain
LWKLASIFDCSPSEITDISHFAASQDVPVVGYVGAGARMHPYDDHAHGDGMYEAEKPIHMRSSKTLAVEVRGDSMEPFISEGFLLYYEERLPGVPVEFLNKLCVVWLDNGECYVKRIAKGGRAGHYNLVSINPSQEVMPDQRVEYSAFVKTMVQR